MPLEMNENEFDIKRTAHELSDWVKCRIEEIAKIPGGIKLLRFPKGLYKTLVEETYPLAIFSTLKYGENENVKIKSVIGNQNYDALIYNGTKPKKIEITLAHEGENEHLRKLLMEKNGFCFSTSKIVKRGTKSTEIEIKEGRRILTSRKEQNMRSLKLISQAIRKKCEKIYSSNTSLLVLFKDNMTTINNEILKEYLEKKFSTKVNPFKSIYVIGWYKNTFIEITELTNKLRPT